MLSTYFITEGVEITMAFENGDIREDAFEPNGEIALVKRIGKMTYRVRVHFSTTNPETMNDKIMRMLRNEVRQM